MKKKFLVLLALALMCLGSVEAWGDDVGTAAELTTFIADSSLTDLNLTADITMAATFTLDRDITVTGNGHTLTAPSTADSRHFIVSGYTLAISDAMTFAGSNTSGGIEVSSSGTVTFGGAVIFSNNRNTSDNGGAINLTSGTVTFSDTATFNDNRTTNGSGGAIYIGASGTVTFSDTATFSGNFAGGGYIGEGGGALFVAGGGGVVFNSTATFTSNTADNDGGAIYAAASTATLTFGSSELYTFTSNQANTDKGVIGHGGAIRAADASQIPAQATFTNNQIISSGSGTLSDNWGLGGAIYVASGALTLTSTHSFTGNSTPAYGGAVYSVGSVTVNSVTTFSGNHVELGNGGAIYSEGDVTVTNSTLSGNYATAGDGGAIYTQGRVSSVTGSTFTGNYATAGNGGAIYSSGTGTTTITSSTFTGNTASGGSGGAVYSTGTVTTVTNSTFTENTAGTNGGAIYSGGTSAMTISGSTFGGSSVGNTAGSNGGAVYASGNVSVSNSPFTENKANDGSGGAIYCLETVTSVQGTSSSPITFTGNAASANGGAIYSATSSTAAGNVASAVNYATFSGNAADNGGAIYSTSLGGTTVNLSIAESTFSENVATSGGGGVFSNNPLTVATSYFVSNQGNSTGGGAIQSENNVTVNNTRFEQNMATNGVGGAIITNNAEYTVAITASLFKANSAGGNGGALGLIYAGATTIKQCSFVENVSKGMGGAVYVNSPIRQNVAKLENDSFFGNQANGTSGSRGGAVAAYGYANLINCTIAFSNSATEYGGGVYIMSSTVYLGGCLVVGNVVGNSSAIGADVFTASSQVPNTLGYNRIGRYGFGNGAASWTIQTGNDPNDMESDSWGSSDFFSADSPISTTGLLAGLTTNDVFLTTIELNEPNPSVTKALDVIPNNVGNFPLHEDGRGSNRRPSPSPNGRKDVGAIETQQDNPDDDDDDDDDNYSIRSVTIGGIPNTLTTVGQTAALNAIVTYINGNTSKSEGVTWASSNTGVAVIGATTGIIYTRNLGSTTISVTTTRRAYNGSYATASVTLNVTNYLRYTNVHPSVYNLLYELNNGLEQDDMTVGLAEANAAGILAQPFQAAYSGAALVGTISQGQISFARETSAPAVSGFTALRSGAPSLTLASQTANAVLPMKYTWNLSKSELKDMTGKEQPTTAELFSAMNIGFVTPGGAYIPVVGSGGVNAAASPSTASAESIGALSVSQNNNGATVDLTTYLVNAEGTAAQAAGNLLAVPDGTADTTIDGAMWAMKSTSSNGGGNNNNNGSKKDGGGDGGCSAGSLGLTALLLAAPALARRKRS